MHAATQLGADNRPAESPLRRLERAVGAACEVVIREQDALINKLALQSQRFGTAIGLDKDGVAFFDDDFKLIAANSRYCEIYGLGPDAARPGAVGARSDTAIVRRGRRPEMPLRIARPSHMRMDSVAVWPRPRGPMSIAGTGSVHKKPDARLP